MTGGVGGCRYVCRGCVCVYCCWRKTLNDASHQVRDVTMCRGAEDRWGNYICHPAVLKGNGE